MSSYCIKSPVRAILNKSLNENISVTLPVGAVVLTTDTRSTTLFGMVGVYWEGRHYSIYPSELVKKAERVSGSSATKATS